MLLPRETSGTPLRLLLTGVPGIGKTTLIRRVLERLGGVRASGFYTEELREAGERTGFQVVTLEGGVGRLASTRASTGPRVGRYVVDVEAFEAAALPSLAPRPEVALYVVDEIGRMECLSTRFVQAVRELLQSGRPLLATVALRGGGFLREVRSFPGATLLEVTHGNREQLVEELASQVLGVAPGR